MVIVLSFLYNYHLYLIIYGSYRKGSNIHELVPAVDAKKICPTVVMEFKTKAEPVQDSSSDTDE